MSFEHDRGPGRQDPLGGDLNRPVLAPRGPAAIFGRLRPWIEWFGVARLLATALVVVAVVAAGWWLVRPAAPPTEAGLPFARATDPSLAPPVSSGPPAASSSSSPDASAPGPDSTSPSLVVVYVAGAVVSPGVYELPADARVHLALDVAGGLLPEAATGTLNLAAPLADGERIYVPLVGEEVPAVVEGPAVAAAGVPPTTSPGPIDLNRATAAQLDDLPGIGPATAQAIVDHRAQNGPFASVDDLEAVRGIGPAKLEAIRALVRV